MSKWLTYTDGINIKTVGAAVPANFLPIFDELVKRLSYDGRDLVYNTMTSEMCEERYHQTPHGKQAIKDDEIARLLKELNDAVGKDIKQAQTLGKEQGGDLLLRMNSGDLTMKDFDKTLERDKKRSK